MKIPLSISAFIAFHSLAFGVMIPTYDMASLAYQSEFIISTETPPIPKASTQEIIVKRVFKGNLIPGDKIIVSYYEVPSEMAWNKVEVGEFKEVVLFIDQHKETFHSIYGGLRLITSKNVWGVRQISNPGPLGLWPYSPEFLNYPSNFFENKEKGKLETLFFADLNESIERSEIFKKAERNKDTNILKLFIYPGSDYLINFLREKAATDIETSH